MARDEMNGNLQQSGPADNSGGERWRLPAFSPAQGSTAPSGAPAKTDLPNTAFLHNPPEFRPPVPRGKLSPIRWDTVPTPRIGKQVPWEEQQKTGHAVPDSTLPEGPQIEIPIPGGHGRAAQQQKAGPGLSAAEQMLQELDSMKQQKHRKSFSSLLEYNAGYDEYDSDEDDAAEDTFGTACPASAPVDFTQWGQQSPVEGPLLRMPDRPGVAQERPEKAGASEEKQKKALKQAAANGEVPAAGSTAASLLAEMQELEAASHAIEAPPRCAANGDGPISPEESGSVQAQPELNKKKLWARMPNPLPPRKKRTPQGTTGRPSRRDGHSWKWKRMRKATMWLAVPLMAAVVLFQFIGFAVIDGASMTPSLSEHDFLVYWKFPGQIERGEVLLSRPEGYNGQILAKRVIGLPGDIVEVDDEGRALLNGEPYSETTAVYGAAESPGDVNFPIRVGDGEYFMLGDNRAVSLDSRQSVIGQVSQEEIIGKVICWFHIE